MNTFHRHLLTAVAVASLAACSSVKLDDRRRSSRAPGRAPAPAAAPAAPMRRAARRRASPPVDVTGTSNVNYSNLPRIVYFDFDSYVVKDDYRPVIEANAKALTANRKMKMAVEGHTDDRGSSEYNLALGQRRAEAVVKSLTLLGADADPARGGELRQGAAGGAGRERRGVGEEPSRRAGEPLSMSASRGPALVAATCVAARRAGRRRAGARRRCSTTTRRAAPSSTCRKQLEQSNEQARARQNEQMTQMSAQIDQLKRSLLELQRQHRGAARRQRASMRGQIEELARNVAELQRKQTDLQQGVDERIRKVEPQKVTVDDKEFSVDPEEKRSYDEALAGFRARRVRPRRDRLQRPAEALSRNSGYRQSALFWLGNAQYAQARLQGGDRDLPQPGRERARQPARARGAAGDRQLPGRAEGHQGGAQDDRRPAQGLSEVGSRAGRTRAAGGAAMTPAPAGVGASPPRRRRRRPRAPLRRPAPPVRRRRLRAASAPRTSPSSASAASARGRPRRWRAAASPR